MRTSQRTRAAVALTAVLAGLVLTLFATAGPAVAFFSGGLFLDVQIESPARSIAKGAGVDVPLEVTCNAPGGASVQVTVTQHAGSGVAQGTGSTPVGCTGSGQRILVRVFATSGGKSFDEDTAVVHAQVSGCRQDVCGSETASRPVKVQD
jgi:hypothetical protein